MEKKIWDQYLECVKPGPNYSLTTERRKMLSARYAGMVAAGKSRREPAEHLAEAIDAFSQDDYFMGRKKGYKGAGPKGIEEIFRTQEIFEEWCCRYDSNE